jgi:hypothetical protein
MKHKWMGLLVILLPSAASVMHAQTGNWMPIAQRAEFNISADTSATLRQESSIATVWVKTKFAKAQKVSDKDTRTFVSSVNRYKLNCNAGTESVGPGAFYDPTGLPVMAISSGYTPWQEPISGTPAEDILTRVCDVLRSRQR